MFSLFSLVLYTRYKMKIIGHRGAAGLKLENTITSIEKALSIGVDAVEFDVRLTRDGQPILSHDDKLARIGGGKYKVSTSTYAELQKVKLNDGESIAHLRQALTTVGATQTVIEVKVEGGVKAVLETLKDFPSANIIIASPVYSEIKVLKQLRPEISGFIRVVVNPFEAITYARAYKADGIDINFWIMNPLTYWLAQRLNLTIMVYTVNHHFFARFLRTLYPGAWICTNYPNKFIKRKRRSKSTKGTTLTKLSE